MSSQIAARSLTAAESTQPSQDFVGRILSNSRRRALLNVLESREGVFELDRVAEWVVAEELDGDWSAFDEEKFDRVLVTLYHNHLPMLADAGFVDLDDTDDGVFVCPNQDLFEQAL
ncbi:hypothetical protein ACFPYI_06455 [Halomarina salina]|uniref:DUF7344 domain-containing protein n=1 Tax=Halomarina salina TaxID=1872699 RepID=A0ABD5RKB6_9EURY|nr:hypothetical protein [Halomarina salina]